MAGEEEKERLRRRAMRLIVTGIAALLGTGGVMSLVQSNVQEWAKANNQDQYLVKYASPIMDRVADFAKSAFFLPVTCAIIGGAVFLWLDYALRQRTKKMGIGLLILALVIAGLGVWVLLNPAIEKSAATLATPSLAPASPITPTADAAEASSQPSKAEPPQAKPSAPFYSKEEIEILLRATREISTVLNEQAVPMRDKFSELLRNFDYMAEHKQGEMFRRQLNDLMSGSGQLFRSVTEIQKKYQYHNEFIAPVFQGWGIGTLEHDLGGAKMILDLSAQDTTQVPAQIRQKLSNSLTALQNWMSRVSDGNKALVDRLRLMAQKDG